MNKTTILILLLLILLSAAVGAQNAPVTTVGTITNATTSGNVVVPVTVSNFVSIGSFTLTLRYRSALVTYVSASVNPAFSGVTVTNTIAGSIGKLVITWPQTPGGITLPDGAHLLDLTFTYLSGTTSLSWGYTSGLVCEYRKYSAGNYILLNDTPKTSYYINGGISNRTAPVTTAGSIANAVPGNSYDVPVTVTGFTTIGSMYLQLEWDSTVLVFDTVFKNASFGGAFSWGVANSTGTKKILTVGWYGSSLTLANGSTLYTVRFVYQNNPGGGNYSCLSWFDNGPSCEYADANGYVLIDWAQDTYYKFGAVYSQLAAMAWLPTWPDAPALTALTLPVKTKSFNNIHSFNLAFEYDTSAMTYNGYTPNAAFSGALVVTNTVSSGAKKKINISWPGPGPLSLADSSTIVILNVTSKNGSSALSWIISDATSCRFNDAIGNAFYDLPKSSYYIDGLLSTHVAPLTVAGQASPSGGSQCSVPVVVYNYNGIGNWSWIIDYDPGVLSYASATVNPTIGGTFAASTVGTGRISMTWTGTAQSLPDSTELVSLTFNYSSGESVLAFFDDGNSCRYAANSTDSAYYDKPTSQYYVNGYVGPNLLAANFTASNLLPLVNQVITLTDLSTGSPTAWLWSITPSTYTFVNGTGSASQNPQVKFTVNGVYSITLRAFKGTRGAVKMRSDYIHAGTPGLWTGISGTDWNTASNWHNYLVPSSIVAVNIPTSAPNWPHLTGDLNIGGQCSGVTMTGNAQMTVDGNVVTGAGKSLVFTGNGTLILAGNWDNQGTFSCGTGTVEFSGGTGDATVLNNGITNTFYKITVMKNVIVRGNVVVTGMP